MNNTVKSKIIDLVQNTKDEQFLNQLYSILDSRVHFEEGKLFDQLSNKQKEETLQSLEDSNDPNELVDHDEFMKEIRVQFG